MNPDQPSSGDVVREHWPVEEDKSVNLYLGTGRCGGCFDAFGLQHQDPLSPVARRVSRTWLAHAGVWHRGRHGLDTQVPLARLAWSHRPGRPIRYRQHLELSAGRLTTEFDQARFRYRLVAFTDPSEATRDLIFLHLDWEGEDRPDLVVSPVPVYPSDYSGDLPARGAPSLGPHSFRLDIERGTSRGTVHGLLRGDVDAGARDDGVRLRLGSRRGTLDLVLALGPVSEVPPPAAADRSTLTRTDQRRVAAHGWRTRWRTGLPVNSEAATDILSWRSAYHLLCSYAPDRRSPAPPMGFTGNAWGFHFPQDLSYIHPALIALGHSDITRAHVEFYHSRLGDQTRLTREIYRLPGVCWSWEFPIGPGARLFQPEDGGVPNPFQFEIHNAAYPARMAVDTATVLPDPHWKRDIAWPIVQSSARFLAAGLQRERDGRHSLHVVPSMGQDEFGGPDAKNYLCALLAARYTLGAAVALATELTMRDSEVEGWAAVLREGLAFERLRIPGETFLASNESAPFVPGAQKHPVQTNPLWLFPPAARDPYAVAAYRERRRICRTERDGHRHTGVPTGFYDGWTLFAFLLAARRLGDTAGLRHERAEMLPSRLIDPDAITIYESSGYWQHYYTTSMGLYLQAMGAGLPTSAAPGALLVSHR